MLLSKVIISTLLRPLLAAVVAACHCVTSIIIAVSYVKILLCIEEVEGRESSLEGIEPS